MKIARVSFALLGLLVLSGFAYGGQILANGGFESGTISPWTNDTRFGTGTGWLIISTGCNSGSFCTTDTGNVGLKQTFAGVSTTIITDVSFYEKNGLSEAVVDFFYQGGGDDEFPVPPTSGVTWKLFDATSDLRTNATLVGFEVFGNVSANASQLDDLSITTNAATTPEPSSLMLMLTGLALGPGRKFCVRTTSKLTRKEPG